MNLYRLRTEILGVGFDISAFLEYVIAKDEEQVEEYVNNKYHDGKWFADPERDEDELRWDVLAQNGDFHRPNDSEPDQKFGWTEPRLITPEEADVLVRLGIAVTLDP